MSYLKYGILGLLFGILAIWGSWAMFYFVWEPTQIVTATLNMTKGFELLVIMTVATIILGTILEMIFSKSKN